ncbi:Bardet-Biedl syndrome 4 protein isoform X2 [Schistocerca americana]|uniref:Bardet-Biedl syndrome 4 protein isoform X2 n=1 Tax=Schistocerca americana TaxID=7009 RepID=UPI001F4FBC25|nr:Bardet-Biedl syndrome 4 protein isoform X2 [Schistocerca americana]
MNSVNTHHGIPNGRPSVGISNSARVSSVARSGVGRQRKVPDCPLIESRNWLIHLHYARKEFGICKILIQEELEKSKGFSEFANYMQGLILRHEGRIQDSLEYFQTCHAINPMNVDNIKQVARSLYLLGRHRLALEAYREAESLVLKPEWDIYHNLGMCLLHLNERVKAKECISKAIDLSRQECSYVALAKIYLLENDIGAAVNVYNAACSIYPENSDLATTLGLLYMKLREYQKAFEKLGSALAHNPSSAKALLAMGSIMQDHKDCEVALSKYKIATQYAPESAPLWSNIGMCFFEMKKFIAAISCLKRANHLSPFDWKILYNLGLVHLVTQQYASAFHYLSASINLHHRYGNAFMLLALTLKKLGDPDNAQKAFEQAARLDPTDASIPLNYAIFLAANARKEEAAAQLKSFQDIAQQGTVNQEMLEVASKMLETLSVESAASLSDNKPADVRTPTPDYLHMGPDEV